MGLAAVAVSSRGLSRVLNRVARYALLIVMGLWMCCPPEVVVAREPREPGRLERVGGLSLAYLHGDPYEMGLQQGALLRVELRSLVLEYLYRRLVLQEEIGHFLLLSQARLVDKELPWHLRSEMRGIADGAGLAYQDVLLLNTMLDLQALGHKLPSWGLFPALFSGSGSRPTAGLSSFCSSFAGWGSATAEGRLLVGHNLDCAAPDPLQHYLLITVRRPSQGNASVAFGLVGGVGAWAGMNAERLAVTLSSSPSCDVLSSGQPLPFLLRQVLESTGDIRSALRLIVSAPRLYGGNVILADGKAPSAVVLELSARQHALFEGRADGGLLLRTNHFLASELKPTQQAATSGEEQAWSEARLERLSAMLESNEGWIGVEKALAFLVDARSAFSSYSRGPAALYSILLVPGECQAWIAASSNPHALERAYVRVDFTPYLLGGR